MRFSALNAVHTIFAAVLFSSNAHATILQGSGSFSSPYTGGPIAVLSSTFAFSFDQSVVAPAGAQAFHNIPVTSFSLSPNPLGATTFDTTNSGVSLFYSGTTLTDLVLGGLVDGTSTIGGAAPYSDFYFTYHVANASLQNTLYHLPPNGALGNGGGGTANVQFIVVPEPATLGAASLVTVAALRRRRR